MASPPSSTSTSKKFLLLAAGALAFGSVSAAASIEIGLRAIGYGSVSILAYGHDHYNPDLPEIGYAGRPDVQGIQTREGVSEVHFNSHGFNDVEHGKIPDAAAFRIVVIGNSYSMAIQVARADGFVSRLGNELEQCPTLAGRKIETINLGVEGYTIDQQFLVLRDYGLSLSPNFVLLQTNIFLVPGDFDPSKNLSPRLEMRDPDSISVDRSYLVDPQFTRRASSAAALLQRLSDHSRLLQYMLEYRRVSTNTVAETNSTPTDPRALERYREDRDLAFKQINGLLRTRKIPWAVTIVPTADAMSYLPPQPDPLRMEWTHLAASNNVPVFDVEEEAKAQVRATGKYLHGFGAGTTAGHLNRFGNAFYARALGARLCEFLGTLSSSEKK